jgi:amino acid adenylation domain-containing protein/non-ribosomal peptide synthase protein (TIGR01720 family)
MTLDERQIARRFAALKPDARRGFLAKLQAAGLHFAELPIVPADRTAHPPLSYGQRSLWLTWQLDPGSPAYNMPGALTLRGALNVRALESALRALIDRHEVLRTVYPRTPEGEPFQHVLHDVVMSLPLHDLRHLPFADRMNALSCLKTAFAREPFKLDAAPPLRLTLWRLGEKEHVLGLALHHIAGDGGAIGILIDELLALYGAARTGEAATLNPLEIQFSDYATWQRNWFEAGEQERQLAYWRGKLGSEHPPTVLPLDRPRGASHRDKPRQIDNENTGDEEAQESEARLDIAWPQDLGLALRQIAQQHGATLFMAVLALLKLTLYRFSGQTEQRVGAPIANRQRPETSRLIGYLTNMQVLRTQVDPRGGFADLLKAVRDTVIDAQMHPDLPFDMLVDALQPARQAGLHPLFQVKCTQQEGLPKARTVAGLEVDLEALSGGQAHFDLSVDFMDRPAGLAFSIAYDRHLFDAATVSRIGQAFTHLARQVVTQPEAGLTEWMLPVPPADLRGLDAAFAHTDVLTMWRDTLAAGPHETAVQDEQQALTRAELDARSDGLATEMIARGVSLDERVAIHAERSCEFVLGVLAVLKAGAAYVPLDPRLPVDRLHHQLKDSQARMLLVAQPWHEAPAGLPQMSLASQPSAALASHLPRPSHPHQAAYVIYTSGSTGQPKGVVVSRGALANYVQALLAKLGLPEGVRAMAMVSTVGADLGHTTFFGALCSGRALHMIGQECAFDPDRFAARMAGHRIDVLKIVPSHLQALLQAAHPEDVLPWHALILGGEATPWPLLDRIRALRPGCRVINHYGPTETTVGALTQASDDADTDAPLLPLGRPLANLQALVLGPDLQVLPQGMAGELYLGGAGVARGYQQRPGQTAERFIAHPFMPGERLYRTGDRVQQCREGGLVFLGRMDDQVKVRGYRVELQEVAQVLRAQPGVTEAEVIARPDEQGRMRLLGYVVLAKGMASVSADPDPVQTWHQALVRALPDYMLPSAIVCLASLPLTPNGKVDRRALPESDQIATAPIGKDDAPRGDTEQMLAEIWAQALKLDRVGRHDNFFELGGDSILTLQIVARARKRGLNLTAKQLMSLQTIAAMGEVVKVTPQPPMPARQPSNPAGHARANSNSHTDTDTDAGKPFDLTPIQTWFFEQRFDEPHHWNQSVLLDACADMPLPALREAIGLVVSHHEALRMRFTEHDGRWMQAVTPVTETGELLSCVNLVGMMSERVHGDQAVAFAAREAMEDAQRCLSLQRPFRAIWMDAGPGQQSRLLLVAHHLIVDAVSWRILIDDLQTACAHLLANVADVAAHDAASVAPAVLSAPPTSLRTWSSALAQHARATHVQDEMPYWQAQVADRGDDLPGDRTGRNLVRDARTIDIAVDAATTARLLSKAPSAYRTQVDDLLLTALTRTLCAWSAKGSVLIELEGHGREAWDDGIDLSGTVGWFTTLFPVSLSACGMGPRDHIRSIKEQLRQVPNKGLGYGLLRHLGPTGSVLANGVRPQVTFNYLGQLDTVAHEQALWRLSDAQPPAQRSPTSARRSWLDIGAMVRDGQLLLRWTYSEQVHDESTVRQLADAFVDELQTLVAHCVSAQQPSLTPSDVPLSGLNQLQLDELPLAPADVRRLHDLYPLSPMQAGMLFHSAFDPDGSAYVNQVRIDIDGLDADRFAAVWQTLFDRHDVLRTGFMHASGQPLQWVARSMTAPVALLDWQARANADQALDELARDDLARGFDVSAPPLMRLTLVRVSARRHHLIWTRHHLLLDGWSTSLLMAEMLARYKGQPVPAPKGRFRDHIAWLQSRDRVAARQHWQHLLSGVTGGTHLSSALPAPETGEGHRSHRQCFNAESTGRLQAFARQAHVTVNTLVQAAWGLLLQRYTGQDTVCFGATTSGRPAERAGSDQMLGLFINTLPVVVAPRPDQGKVDWLRALQAQNAASREHEHTPLADIQRCATVEGGALFDSLIVFENYPVDEALSASQNENQAGLRFQVRQIREETSYPMTLTVNLGQTLSIEYAWPGRCFSVEQIEGLAGNVGSLLEALMNPMRTSLADLPMLTRAEHQALSMQGAGPEEDAASVLPYAHVHVQIGRQAMLTPQALALVYGARQWTHADLDQRANRLAHHLIGLGVRPEAKVGVAVERGPDMIVAVLAILKAGGAYVPLDPNYPRDRLAHMVEDSGMAWVLSHAATQASVPRLPDVMVLDIDHLLRTDGPAHDPEVPLHGDNVAYVIYTSGSTGKPKGVAVSHQALARHAWIGSGFFGLNSADRMLQFATLNFDGFIEQVFPPLSVGAAIVLRGPELWDTEVFHRQVIEYGVTVADLTTAYWLLLAQDFARMAPVDMARLRQVNVGGEAMPPEGIKAWRDAGLSHIKLLNTYGPTEATVTASVLDCTPFAQGHKPLPRQMPIGHALGGRMLRVLDAQLNPVPAGVVGELVIGGDLLARGYAHRPALTAERFIADPFDEGGARLYRTGDLVRWNADGELAFLGRVDHQVKIRGLRIELGEIEALLLDQAEVREAVVVARPSPTGEKLVAHVSLQEGARAGHAKAISGEALRQRLSQSLPDYMVPAAVVLHDALPLNPNGKVDRKALPDPSSLNAASPDRHETDAAPQGECETALAALWAQVLGVTHVGRSDHFFALGGHSLLALQLSSLLQQRWPGAMTVREIFGLPVLADMAAVLSERQNGQAAMAQSLSDIDNFIDQLENA